MNHKEHFHTLDWLRGVAASCVLLFHWFGINLVNGFGLGFLAVDFFFLLSGFVIAYAYEAKLQNGMRPGTFLKIRLIRLYPMILMGIVAGLVRSILHTHYLPSSAISPSAYLIATAANIAMVPANLQSLGFDATIYPLDGVLWSLFFELIANVIYGIFIRRLTNAALFAIVGASLAWLLYLASAPFATPPGWQINVGYLWHNYFEGFSRIGFSFFFGVLLYRLRHGGVLTRRANLGPIVLSVALILALFPSATLVPAYAQVGILAVVFPVMVLLGANCKLTGGLKALGDLLGRISYPLYVLQIPILWLISGALKLKHLWADNQIWLAAPVLSGVALVSWAVLKLYDEPVRRWLTAGLR